MVWREDALFVEGLEDLEALAVLYRRFPGQENNGFPEGTKDNLQKVRLKSTWLQTSRHLGKT